MGGVGVQREIERERDRERKTAVYATSSVKTQIHPSNRRMNEGGRWAGRGWVSRKKAESNNLHYQ